MQARNRTGAMPSTTDILAEYARLGIRPISGGSGEDDAAAKAAAEAEAKVKADAEAKAKADAEEAERKALGDAGKKALDAEREARTAAERAKKESDKELAALRKEKADREAAEAKAAEDKAKADGEWQKLADERETNLTTVTGERDALKTTVADYEKLLAPLVKERHDAIKAANAEVAKGFPADADLLAQLAWLDDPRTKALLSAQDDKVKQLTRVPMTPNPNGDGKTADAEALASQSRLYRDF